MPGVRDNSGSGIGRFGRGFQFWGNYRWILSSFSSQSSVSDAAQMLKSSQAIERHIDRGHLFS